MIIQFCADAGSVDLDLDNLDASVAYLRDIYVHLPDVRWGDDCRPACPSCHSNGRVAAHDWPKDGECCRRYDAAACPLAPSRAAGL